MSSNPTNADAFTLSQLFNSWVLDAPGTTIGVAPHSKPTLIVTTTVQQSVNGTPYLTILYPNSKLKSFDLHSFFFGCGTTVAEGEAGKPAECTITVAGFRNGQEVAVASYTFAPPALAVSVPMNKAVLPGTFATLQNVTIVQGNPVLNPLVADDFNVTTHT